jgi:hypothetical protein
MSQKTKKIEKSKNLFMGQIDQSSNGNSPIPREIEPAIKRESHFDSDGGRTASPV